MDSPVTPLVASSVLPAALPGWTLSRGREPDELAAAFAAGIALKSLDDLVRSDFTSSEINEALVRQLHRCEFLDDANNIVLVGGPGTGNTPPH